MGQVLDFCADCENKCGCDLCVPLHKWIMDHLAAEQAVRCMDCAKCQEKDMFGVITILVCESGIVVKPDWFCSNGVRKG